MGLRAVDWRPKGTCGLRASEDVGVEITLDWRSYSKDTSSANTKWRLGC